jgi:hypothetical protein
VSTFFELTTLEVNSTYTGSMYASAHTLGTAPVAAITNDSLHTGSWFGLANTWGAIAAPSSSFAASLSEGIWHGIDYSWGTYHIPTESIDRSDVTSNMFPLVDQGVSIGDWNPFPVPEAPPAPVLPPRDLTRFKKAYSSSRHQPVRIRLVRGSGGS